MVLNRVKLQHQSIVFFYWKGQNMFLIGFIAGTMVGGTLAIVFHCLIIIGKDSDKFWEEEKIMKKEEKLEK